jgi:hypothetical protein
MKFVFVWGSYKETVDAYRDNPRIIRGWKWMLSEYRIDIPAIIFLIITYIYIYLRYPHIGRGDILLLSSGYGFGVGIIIGLCWHIFAKQSLTKWGIQINALFVFCAACAVFVSIIDVFPRMQQYEQFKSIINQAESKGVSSISIRSPLREIVLTDSADIGFIINALQAGKILPSRIAGSMGFQLEINLPDNKIIIDSWQNDDSRTDLIIKQHSRNKSVAVNIPNLAEWISKKGDKKL